MKTPQTQQIRLQSKQIVNSQSYSNSIDVAPFSAGLHSQVENKQIVQGEQEHTVNEGIVATEIKLSTQKVSGEESTEQQNRTFE